MIQTLKIIFAALLMLSFTTQAWSQRRGDFPSPGSQFVQKPNPNLAPSCGRKGLPSCKKTTAPRELIPPTPLNNNERREELSCHLEFHVKPNLNYTQCALIDSENYSECLEASVKTVATEIASNRSYDSHNFAEQLNTELDSLSYYSHNDFGAINSELLEQDFNNLQKYFSILLKNARVTYREGEESFQVKLSTQRGNYLNSYFMNLQNYEVNDIFEVNVLNLHAYNYFKRDLEANLVCTVHKN